MHDIAPLIGSAELQDAAISLEQLHEVVALHDHVVEFEKGQRLFALQTQLHAVHGQHPIDGEMPADIAQKRDVLQFAEPIIVVRHDRARGAAVKAQVAGEYLADSGDIGLDLLLREQPARFIPPRGVADHRDVPGVPARLVLQAAQHHYLHEAADVQAVGRRIETDVGGYDAGSCPGIQGRSIRYLVDVAALTERAQKIRLELIHGN